MSQIALLLSFATAWYMTGLVWFVQGVHYPLFQHIGSNEFAAYHAEHVRRTGPVVAPAMLVELLSSLVLVAVPVSGVGRTLSIAGAAAALLVWASTFAVQVPLHSRLTRDGSESTIHRLVATNLTRSLLWSLHALINTWMVWLALHPPD